MQKMAMCIYSINFSQSPSSPSSFPLLTLFKDQSTRVQAHRIVSRQSYGITGFKSLSWMCCRRHVKPLNLGSLCSVQGPDVEDGWGFVEASIDGIS